MNSFNRRSFSTLQDSIFFNNSMFISASTEIYTMFTKDRGIQTRSESVSAERLTLGKIVNHEM